ncbi:RICIN domain-containing protein [Streptosporangium sp. NPDC049376]|uniref:RICIN domain-containing protein n=1 Tax=Streptosporangium sp. NPDC049376 TaxID=3366192 RepID=UPI0037917A0A
MGPIRAGRAVALAAALITVPLLGPSTAVATGGAARTGETGTKAGFRFRASLVARHSGKCLDVERVSTRNGADLHQWTCLDDQPNQEWNLVATSDGYYTLRATHSGKCLDVEGVSTRNGANVHQWTCLDDQPNQEWKLLQRDSGYFILVARHSGKCLDVENAGIDDGSGIDQWTCVYGRPNQEWRLA